MYIKEVNRFWMVGQSGVAFSLFRAEISVLFFRTGLSFPEDRMSHSLVLRGWIYGQLEMVQNLRLILF